MLNALFAFLPMVGAQQHGDVLTRVEHQLPHLGLSVTEERRVDPATGIVLREARDERGRAVDLDALKLAEQQAKIAANGKLSHELVERVAGLEYGVPIEVVFWLVEPAHQDYPQMLRSYVADGLDPQSARQLVLAAARDACAGPNAAFATRLTAAGHTVRSIGEYWPDVFATLPAGEVRRWAADSAVDLCYYSFSEGGPELFYAQGTMRTFNVHDQGITGATGPTKVLVNDCGEVTSSNPDLPPVIHGTTNAVQTHPCGVAGNICSNNATNYGAAKGLPQLYSYDGCGSDLPAQNAWAWGLGQGIDVGNCSWWNGNKGSIVFLDRFFDYTIRNFSVQLFKSNGNQGTSGAPTSTSPGNGYNMICSGAYNDGNTVDWANDVMASYSSYGNPIEGHEKPEVATPGDIVTTTGTTGTQSFNGTSSASPLCCGVGVLLLNQAPALLASMPTLKAALMVGAWHNIEGAQPLSDKDGAGGVHATASHAVVRDGQYENGSFTSSSFPGNVYDKTIALNQGDETRVIALWFSDPDAAYSTDVLKMDLDLTVLDPSGGVVASSAHVFNPFELVQFTPATTGSFTVRLTKTKFLGTSEPYAIAWSTRQDAAVADVTFTGISSLGSNLQTNFRSRYDASVPFVAGVSLYTAPHSIPIGSGWVLPLGADRLANYSLSGNLSWLVSGYSGTLNASGQATGSFMIPNDSRYLGVRFYVSMYTHNTGNPAAVRDTSPAASFVVVL